MKPGNPANPVAGASPRAAFLPAIRRSAEVEEIHIAGVLVQCHPLDLMRVVRAVDAVQGADVFQSSADGRLVVVIEAPTSRAVLGVIDQIRALRGVVNVALVYQHAESAAEMQQALELPVGSELPQGLDIPTGGSQPDESEEHA
jgi:nitrate reductase NapD